MPGGRRIFVIAAVVTVSTNASTIHIAEELWRNDALRTQIAVQAQAAAQSGEVAKLESGNMDRLEAFPIGWRELPTGPLEILKTLLGWLITAAAVSLGAPFWFDLLGKVANLRGSGGKAQTGKASPLKFSFLAENVGTRPATDALVTVEAQGHFRIQPPAPSDDDKDRDGEEDEDRDGEENALEHRKAAELPRPPAAPRGQWERTIGGRPGDAVRAMDVLRRSLYGFWSPLLPGWTIRGCAT